MCYCLRFMYIVIVILGSFGKIFHNKKLSHDLEVTSCFRCALRVFYTPFSTLILQKIIWIISWCSHFLLCFDEISFDLFSCEKNPLLIFFLFSLYFLAPRCGSSCCGRNKWWIERFFTLCFLCTKVWCIKSHQNTSGTDWNGSERGRSSGCISICICSPRIATHPFGKNA